jgi:ABC-type uncharacterized transport system permease subunit
MSVMFNAISIVLLCPAIFLAVFVPNAAGTSRWFSLAVAVIGSSVIPLSVLFSFWEGGVAFSLRITVFTILILYTVLAIMNRFSQNLAILLFPYLMLLTIGASSLSSVNHEVHAFDLPSAWVVIHIVSSIVTYALVTLAAIVALSAYLSQRALKNKQPNKVSSRLPPINEANYLQLRLLVISVFVLVLGLLTGMALQYYSTQSLLVFDHKTVLAFSALIVILGIIYLQNTLGIKGKVAVQFILVAYLLLTLAYPGVKFVGQVLI